MRIDKALTIADLKRQAQRRVPKMFFDYADSGSWTESTYRANAADFEAILLRQRVATNLEDRRIGSTLLGNPVAMPAMLAPVGLTGMQAADGEIKAARAAEKRGIPFTLSTRASARSKTSPAPRRSRSGSSSTSCATARSSNA